MKFTFPEEYDAQDMRSLRAAILASEPTVALHRAETYTRVFEQNEGAPWIVAKALAFREHLETVPLFLRPGDRIAGSLTEIPGGIPVIAEIGIAENNILLSENPERQGYLRGQVPEAIRQYWENRNLWGRWRAYMRAVEGQPQQRGESTQYKFLSCQGHLSPAYAEVLAVGLGGILERVRARRQQECHPDRLAFLTAAEHSLLGVSHWIRRYASLARTLAATETAPSRRADLSALAGICEHVAFASPRTFREALQLVWFCHQAVHIEGHGYSCTPDRLDQILFPFYARDIQAGRLADAEALALCENLILKMRDNTFWGQHNLTQGVCVGGSTPEGEDQTNALSWLLIRAADNLSLPEPLVWIRWHPQIDQDFFDFCLETLAGQTCFPLMMSDPAVTAMFEALGVARQDAFNYVAVGCNELALPGQAYFNPCAYVAYLPALEQALTQGRGYAGRHPVDPSLPPPDTLTTFQELADAVGRVLRRQVQASFRAGLAELHAQMEWGQTPFTSCFFEGCIEDARDMVEGTKYNILACGGIGFANMVDCLAAIREVVYDRGEASLAEIAAACAVNFRGYERLRHRLLAAPKHGNDDPRLADIVTLVERLRDEPVKAICRDPRDGTPAGNCHVVRSSAVTVGRNTGATPDGRLAGTPLASSVAASVGNERSGPTAVLNSVIQLHPVTSWQCGYNVNLRFQRQALADAQSRERVRALLNAYFARGGQEIQINCVDTNCLRAAMEHPEDYPDLVVRVAGFSEFFTKLHPTMQKDILERTEHSATHHPAASRGRVSW